jgi:CheY-like chemotaxis protein
MEFNPPVKILCADDSQDNCELLSFVLSEAGYEIEIAGTIVQALQLAQRREFGLYLIDLAFPDGSGLELIKNLRQIDPAVPIVVCSGNTQETAQNQALQAGAKLFLLKPIDTDTLATTIAEVLRRSQPLDAL